MRKSKRTRARRTTALALGVGLGLAVGAGGAAPRAAAQDMSGAPGLSSGTGSGTGAGGFSGVQRSGSSSLSGVGPSSVRGSGGVDRNRIGPRSGSLPFGPGVDVSFPDDPYLVPFLVPETAGNPAQGQDGDQVRSDLLDRARLIVDPAERSLALRQIANGAIASNQLVMAHQTLQEATSAASEVNVPLVRDQRLIGLVVSLTKFTDALLRTGRENALASDLAENANDEPLPPNQEKWSSPSMAIRLARLEWRRASYLAKNIGNPTYRSEMLFLVAESESNGSSTIANDFGDVGPIAPAAPTVPPAPAPDLEAGRPAPRPSGSARADYRKLADEVLVQAWETTQAIERLIWKNRAVVRLALAASDSRQYSRGIELVRTVPNAEARAEALILLAEGQCWHGQASRATATYQAAAEAAAAIDKFGLRAIMVGFLVDSLISTGRFEDARACVVLYPEDSERFVALGAIAESMGRRHLGEAAVRWIQSEAPPGYRSALYRRVTAGKLYSIEHQRARELPTFEPGPSTVR